MKKKLKLSNKELLKELSERTGNSVANISRIFSCYEDIVAQCIKNKIEVSIGKLGTFTFKEVLPRDYMEWKGFMGDGQYTIFFQKNTDGFVKAKFRLNQSFARTVREQTWVPYGSVVSGENVYVTSENDANKPRIDFKKYIEETRLAKGENLNLQEEIENINPEEDEYDSVILGEEENEN